MATKIIKRTTVTNSIFEELEKKYPTKSERNGVCYAQDLGYITVDVEQFNNPVFRKLIQKNSKLLVVYLYLRERMCHSGWYVLWDEDSKEDIIERLWLWGIEEEESISIIDTLIEKEVIFKIHHNDTDYLVDTQQIFNWEMLQAKRDRDRKSKQRYKEQLESENFIQIEPLPFTSQNNTPEGFSPNTDFDNPFA